MSKFSLPKNIYFILKTSEMMLYHLFSIVFFLIKFKYYYKNNINFYYFGSIEMMSCSYICPTLMENHSCTVLL